MKEFECVQLNHHREIGKTIADWQARGGGFILISV